MTVRFREGEPVRGDVAIGADGLRSAVREQVLPEVRWRYREAARLARLLARPPDDPEVAFVWQMRLEEHAAFLEAMSGRPVVAYGSNPTE